MIFGNTVGYDSIYSYPYESRKITVQEMMEIFPFMILKKEKAVMKEQKIEKMCLENIYKSSIVAQNTMTSFIIFFLGL